MSVFLGILYLSTVLPAEIRSDLEFISVRNPIYIQEPAKEGPAHFNGRQVSETRLAFAGLIWFYQAFVSPQGPPSCNFTFSCSNFLLESIRRYGVVHGFLMAGDRLQRCNQSARTYYRIDSKTGRAIDYPVDAYYLFRSSRVYPIKR